MVPGREAAEFSWRAIRSGSTLGGSEETSEGRGSLLLEGGWNRASGWVLLKPGSVALQQIHMLAMSRFLPDYQQDISRKLSSVFPISQVPCNPLRKQLAQMKTSLNAGRVNRGTMSCFPVLSTSSKGLTESLGESGLFPRLIPGTPSISCTWRKGCRVPPACFRCESCPGACDNSLPPYL